MLTSLSTQIDFDDFKAYASRKEDTIAKSFAQLDVDHNGSISVNDLVRHSLFAAKISLSYDKVHRKY